MYHLLSMLTGVLISAMLAVNGGLTQIYGVYFATVIIHIAGLIPISALILFKRERPFAKRSAWFLYLGGSVGVITTAFNNLAFGRISVSAILALGLLGQSLTGLIIDQYGIMGMPKHAFRKRKAIGLAIVICGIVSMFDKFDALAVVVSLITGVTNVVSRTLNARLADERGVKVSTFYNYLVGLIVSVPVCLILGDEMRFAPVTLSPGLYVYLGGIIGVFVVTLSNITVQRISAFYLSLFLFIGQVFSGVLIDAVIGQAFSVRILTGGVLVTLGLVTNLITDRKPARGGA